ncbi:monocarboxylate transporter 12-like [Gigantopelta aegis]|uniref:monocarboxylate transporter 12-like n=1 Tax=Gigantopelta aegis TaxID=1735272 RepID=UPI001B88841E|nr:monocarboxylate transporter 12-like [Gigantopelta aegis]
MTKTTKRPETRGTTEQAQITTPPDGGWGWVITFSSFMISVLVDGTCFSQGIFFTEFLTYFGQSKSKTSWVGSVLNGSYLTVGPFVGSLTNKYGCRKVAMCGAVVCSSALFISTFSPGIEVFTFTYGFLGGIGFGLMYLPAMVMVGYYFAKKRALATGIACCGSGIGMFVFAPLVEFLLQEYNWKGTTWIMSALILNGILFSMLYRPLEPSGQQPSIEMETLNSYSTSPNSPETPITISLSPPEDAFSFDENGVLLPLPQRSRSYSQSTADNRIKPVKQSMMRDIAKMAHSQDMSVRLRRPGQEKTVFLKPLQRKDIFYSGSVMHLQEYINASSLADFEKAMIRTPDDNGVGDADGEDNGGKMPLLSRVVNMIHFVFDPVLLTSPTFLIYGFSCLICMIGFFVPFMYIPPLAMEQNISPQKAAFLISVIGISNTVGRVAVGVLSDLPWIDCLLVNNLALIIGGVVTCFVPFYDSYGMLAAYTVVFGLSVAVFVSLRSIIMVELMGLDKLTNAFGLVIMCQGISSFIGAPLAGTIADSFGNYNAAFYLAGATFVVGGAVCLPLRKISSLEKRWKAEKERKKHRVPEKEPMVMVK